MTTTKRISLMFTLFSSLLLLIFGICLNIFYLTQRYTSERRELTQFWRLNRWLEQIRENEARNQWRQDLFSPPWRRRRADPLAPLALQRFTNIISLSKDEIFAIREDRQEEDLTKNIVWPHNNLLHKEGNRYMFTTVWDIVHFKNISPIVSRQKTLLLSTLGAILFFAILCYFFSRWFTRNALRDLDKLSTYVHTLDAQNLWHISQAPLFTHLPPDDTIRTVSDAIHTMQHKINDDIQRIKRFVSNVSHELKTPLMIMQSWSELALASQQYKQWLENNIEHIQRLNTLLWVLINHTHAERIETKQTSLHLHAMVDDIYAAMKLKHLTQHNQRTHPKEPKPLTTLNNIPQHLHIRWDSTMTHMILTNLIDNAHKYTSAWWTITVGWEHNTLIIRDTGQWIPSETLPYIREAFWQWDSAREWDHWFGLGLSLVHDLIQNQWRNIQVDSSPRGSAFLISWIDTVTG